MKAIRIFYEPEGLLYHGAAVLYASAGYIVGWLGLFSPNWLTNLLGVLILGHAMTIAAYMVHECGHNLVFRRISHNAQLGGLLSWICGAAYGTYEDNHDISSPLIMALRDDERSKNHNKVHD